MKKPESKKCPNCGACQECGARPQVVPMPYPVYPPNYYPYRPYWSVVPYHQQTTWGAASISTGNANWQSNTGGNYQ